MKKTKLRVPVDLVQGQKYQVNAAIANDNSTPLAQAA